MHAFHIFIISVFHKRLKRLRSGSDARQTRLRRQAGAEGSVVGRHRDPVLRESRADRGVEVQGSTSDGYAQIP